MQYLKINDIDFSKCVNSLTVTKEANYSALTNANGDTVVDYINSKREIEVGIIPLEAQDMIDLMAALDGFSVQLSFLNPNTGILEQNVHCIVPESEVSYYTIQAGKTSFQEFEIKFIEL